MLHNMLQKLEIFFSLKSQLIGKRFHLFTFYNKVKDNSITVIESISTGFQCGMYSTQDCRDIPVSTGELSLLLSGDMIAI